MAQIHLVTQMTRSLPLLSLSPTRARLPQRKQNSQERAALNPVYSNTSLYQLEGRRAASALMCSQGGEVHAGWEMTTNNLPNVAENFNVVTLDDGQLTPWGFVLFTLERKRAGERERVIYLRILQQHCSCEL